MKIKFFTIILSAFLLNSCTENSEENALAIGKPHAGGIIVYVDQTGEHGIVAATTDVNQGNWGYYSTTIGTTGTQIGEGLNNTNEIASAGAPAVGCAIYHCTNLVHGGYDDWYLPSLEELNLLYQNRDAVGINTNQWYWSSSESDAYYAWMIEMASGRYNSQNKGNTGSVRPVRNF